MANSIQVTPPQLDRGRVLDAQRQAENVAGASGFFEEKRPFVGALSSKPARFSLAAQKKVLGGWRVVTNAPQTWGAHSVAARSQLPHVLSTRSKAHGRSEGVLDTVTPTCGLVRSTAPRTPYARHCPSMGAGCAVALGARACFCCPWEPGLNGCDRAKSC